MDVNAGIVIAGIVLEAVGNMIYSWQMEPVSNEKGLEKGIY